jgi:hypothetical protein
MAITSHSPATRTAITYITVGALIVIWTVVWFIYLNNNPPSSSSTYYIVGGFMASGVILLMIGLGLGSIGRSARQADTPTATIVQTAAPVAPVQQVPVTSGNLNDSRQHASGPSDSADEVSTPQLR